MPKTDANSAFYAAFRLRLKELRDEMDLSQEQMATALGLSKANYQKYEDRSKFPLHKLEQLAVLTHQPLEFILTGRNRRSPGLRLIRK